MKFQIGNKVRIKSGPFHDEDDDFDNIGIIESVEFNFCYVDMDSYDDLDNGNIIPVKFEDLELYI